MRKALGWTLFWTSLAFIFAGVVYWTKGSQRSLEFVTAYLVEESLSMDNLFVFMLIFDYFKIPALDQPKVLKYGIVGAIVMRFILIYAGVKLVNRFYWLYYIFGTVLIVTAIQMILDEGKEMEPEANLVLRIFRRKGWTLTPFMATIVVIEVSDLVFATDSIPAVLAISRDPFIVFTSNVFAILGLRSLYFVLQGVMRFFHYLKYGLGAVLIFIGVKMLLMNVLPIGTALSLGVVVICLAASVACSLWIRPGHE